MIEEVAVMRMLVFPYGFDCEPIIRHTGLLEPCYEIAALVSPGGWGLSGKNIAVENDGIVLPVYEALEEVEEEFDSLFIPEFEVDEVVENRLINKMMTLLPNISTVICAASLTAENRKRLEELCCTCVPSCNFIDISMNKRVEEYGLTVSSEKYPSVNPLSIPVVVIAGVWEKTDKFEISLSLRERFMRDGFKVSQIGSRHECEMLGFHSFPGFMFQKDLDGIDKILCLNRWLIQIEENEQPDVILITIPGAMQDFNEKFTRGFGLLHHLVFQAVMPDVILMCTFYFRESAKALEELSMSCKYRFGAPVDLFHMSNLIIDFHESEERNRIVTNSIYREMVSETVAKDFSNSSVPVFNGVDSQECDQMYEMLMEKLMPKDVQAVI